MAKALGGKGDEGKTNPEELFAAGYVRSLFSFSLPLPPPPPPPHHSLTHNLPRAHVSNPQ